MTETNEKIEKDYRSMNKEEYEEEVKKVEEELGRDICGAKTKNFNGRPCRGKPIPQTGKCRFHGGFSTGPKNPDKLKGNKNAVRTGIMENISLSTMTEEEKEMFENINTDALERVKYDIKMLQVREYRMMKRIEALGGQEYWNERKEYEEGYVKGKPTKLERKLETDTLRRIQEIEDALTRVQERKTKLFELKHKIESGGQADVDVNMYINALENTANNIWNKEKDNKEKDNKEEKKEGEKE